MGAPNDQELVGIHAAIRVAQKTVDLPGMGGAVMLSRLLEHLFDVQMARYRSKYLGMNATYEPPALPVHLSVQLEPVSGVPSDEGIIKVQDAVRSYQQFANASSIFDPIVNTELSQHLFDIQMARYMQRAKQNGSVSVSRDAPSLNYARAIEETVETVAEDRSATNNPGTGAEAIDSDHPMRSAPETDIRGAIERSNRLAEQAIQLAERSNLLIERSNQIAERANQLAERSNQPAEQSNNLVERFNELFGKLNGHFEQSNHLAELSKQRVEKLEEVLRIINRVLVGIQHAIVRNHKGNTYKAADCLVNEKGDVLGQSRATSYATFEWTAAQFSRRPDCQLPIMIEGVQHTLYIDNEWLGKFLRFYGVGEWYFEDETSTKLRDGPAGIAQCPIPERSSFTYQFTINGQYGTYWWHAHASTQLADGIHGPLIVHSPDDPLKRGVDYDEDQILVIADWYHDTSAVITSALLSSSGYHGSIAAPSPNSALINGQGIWDCATYGNSSTCFTQTPYEIQVVPNKKYRFRLINTAAHAMFWVSLDGHTFNVTEADDTGVYSEANSALHRIKFHNGQRYSVIVDTSVSSVGDSYWLRAQMNTACLTTLPDDFSNITYAIVRYVGEDGTGAGTTDPTTSDWADVVSGAECTDLDTSSLTPIVVKDAPTTVVKRGMFQTGFAVSLDSDGNLDTGFEVNSTEFVDLVYQPILYTIAAGGTASNVASVVYDSVGAVDLIINNLDTAIDHPYHLHGMTFWIVAEGSGTLSLEDAESVSYNTTNPIRRDTHIIPASSWAVLRFTADNSGVWFMHCHIDWHLAEGFAAVVVVQPDAVAQMTIPSANTEMCSEIPDGLDVWSTSLGRRRRSLPDPESKRLRRSRVVKSAFHKKKGHA